MVVSTDMKKDLMEAVLVVYLDATPAQKGTRNLLFTSFLGMCHSW